MGIFKALLKIFHKEKIGKAAKNQNVARESEFKSLELKDGVYYVSERVPYQRDGVLKGSTVELVFDFAYRMAFTSEGEHRDHRSGGSHKRKNGEIFANTFQGKIAECAACNHFYRFDTSVMPDFSVSKLGTWDTADITVCGREIAVKSTKHYGQLLLLETKDWDKDGNYIPNAGKASYDIIMLIRLKPSCEELLKRRRVLYSDHIDRTALWNIVREQMWEYNYVGYITRDELKSIIGHEQIICKGAVLNGSTTMDADNYYIQAGDMRKITETQTWIDT